MAIKPLNKSWGSDTKNLNYVGKDFSTLKQNLVEKSIKDKIYIKLVAYFLEQNLEYFICI